MRSYIAYYVERLPGDRGQLLMDVVIDDKLLDELSGPVGSPAPIATVEQCVRKLDLSNKR